MARTRGKRTPSGPRRQPRIVSRPSVLPLQKDSTTRTLLNGIDALADQFRRASDGSSTWKVKKGDSRSIWVAHVRITGDWDWTAIHLVSENVEHLKTVYKDISDRRLAFARFEYTQYDDDGNEVNRGWYAPSPLTTWESLIKSFQEESDEEDSGSRARRYENTIISTIVISFASRTP